tara:strand:+ start:4809 stop:4958 length:150 start_codon:yes stop_codon:yes gene_type:complete
MDYLLYVELASFGPESAPVHCGEERLDIGHTVPSPAPTLLRTVENNNCT